MTHRAVRNIRECRAQVESEVHKTTTELHEEALLKEKGEANMLMIRGSGKACQVLHEFQAFCQKFPTITLADLEAGCIMLPLEFK